MLYEVITQISQDGMGLAVTDSGFAEMCLELRITSYNVCYTKLLRGMGKLNREKAAILYDYLDSGDFFRATAQKGSRSLMNIPFLTKIGDPEKAEAINKKFVAEAEAAGLVNLAGHRLVGGMRASIYNAMPKEGVQALVDFMKKFAAANAEA